MTDSIRVQGARTHNLKNLSVTIPRDRLVVFTGLSGSGKSSLAFDTIYAEGQRRYVESLSSYARQFLGQAEKPDVDFIEGLSPSISIDQKTASHNPRSTVGTITEVHDYLRLLYARIGVMHCWNCGREVTRQSPQQIVDQVLGAKEGTQFMVLGRVVDGRKGEYSSLLEDLTSQGFSRVRVDGTVHELAQRSEIHMARYEAHTIDVVVDRLTVKRSSRQRLTEAVEAALKLTKGTMGIWWGEEDTEWFSEKLACVHCGLSFTELAPRDFSFNSPYGACTSCGGLGTRYTASEETIIADRDLSLSEGAIEPWGGARLKYFHHTLVGVARMGGFSMTTPWKDLRAKDRRLVLEGEKNKKAAATYRGRYGRVRSVATTWNGVIEWLEHKREDAEGEWSREWAESFMAEVECGKCKGQRLKPEVLAVRIQGRNIAEVSEMNIAETRGFFQDLEMNEHDAAIATAVIKEITERLGFLLDVGLSYLTLARGSASLSGGEAQRIRLASQIGSYLVGVLYVLDEPSIGLHQSDNQRLLATLERLVSLGNSVIVVEHDEETIRAAEFVVDLGPGAGEHGGEVVYAGDVAGLAKSEGSLTGAYLSGRRHIAVPEVRRAKSGALVVRGAKANNLKDITVEFPLGQLVAVTGVSGSGKSTLVNDTLLAALERDVMGSRRHPGTMRGISGAKSIDKVIAIDQAPIGRTPRSNPATYTGVFTKIRELFASLPESKVRGYSAGRFSFNVKGGRCETCAGEGTLKIEMHFLADVYVLCETCEGARFNRETLEVKYRGKSIADVLNLPIAEAAEFFAKSPGIARVIDCLDSVGLGYVRLGQAAPTLSGGEAQRVKLATELARRATGHTLYVLDEPTTGLHFEDVAHLLGVLGRLVDQGNSVIVIEHNLDVIKVADWVIDLGPGGGDAGGEVVAEGTPEEVARTETATGKVLRADVVEFAAPKKARRSPGKSQ